MTYAKKNITVITGSRAEYSLLRSLLKLIKKDKTKYILNIIVTASHLSNEFGYTKNEILSDGFTITDEIETLVSSNSSLGMAKSIGLSFIGITESLSKIKPDLLICLGDRYEIFAAAYSASLLNIPVAHIHGGELTYGSIDDKFRHAITKASTLHFPCTEIYRKRIIQMGEKKEYVFNYGALAVERVKKIKSIPLNKLNNFLGINISTGCILVTVHPETTSKINTNDFIKSILLALEKYEGLPLVITYANSDPGGAHINNLLESFCKQNPNKCIIIKSLGYDLYSNIMKYSKLVMGNSSSGIIEAPILGIPTLNIGSRQDGRIFTKSIYSVKPDKNEILFTIRKILEQKKIKNSHPYGEGKTALRIYKTITKFLKYKKNNFGKRFVDIKF